MSKYTEAEEHFICFLTECSMWCRENRLTSDFKTAIEALQIADRLEQVNAKEIAKHIECNDCTSDYCIKFGETCGRVISTMLIVDKALADLRGDEE